jgi:hypothetical protein
VKRKRSARAAAADKLVSPAAQELVQTALDRVTPYVQQTADKVAPVAQSAASKVGPLAATAAERINAAGVLLSPYAQNAAGQIGPLAQSAAAKVAPLAAAAAVRVTPYAHQAADLVTPYAQQAADFVTPYAHQAADLVTPYTKQVGPLATAAVQRGAHAAQEAVEALGPKLEEARDLVTPAVEAARDRVTDDLLPRLGEALSAAAAAPVVVEATKRGRATIAAARGELELPAPRKKGRWLKRLAIILAVAGVAAVVVRKLLGSKDADWQAARPTTPYVPSTPSTATSPAAAEDSPTDTTDTAATTDAVGTEDRDGDAVTPPAAGLVDEEALVAADAIAGDENAVDAMLPTDAVEAAPQTPLGGEGAPVAPTTDDFPADDAVADVVAVDELDVDEVEPNPDLAPEESDLTPEQASTGGEVSATDVAEPVDSVPGDSLDPAAATSDQSDAEAGDTASDAAGSAGGGTYASEGAYVGSEPPEGFVIKGNENSMKYHTPESGGYGDTIAEVWFSSEQAAEEAGFVKAQG